MADHHSATILGPASMALSLAVSGYTAGFIAFVEAEKIDLREIQVFRGSGEDHFGQTLLLLYEVVRQPNLELLRYLIEVADLSLTIKSDWTKSQLAMSQRLQSQFEGLDDEYRYRLVATPYRVATLLEFAKKEVDRYWSSITETRQLIAKQKVEVRVLAAKTPRASTASAKELDAYLGTRISNHFAKALTASSAQVLDSDERVDYDNELAYRRTAARLATLRDDLVLFRRKHAEAKRIVTYLDGFNHAI